VNVYLAKLEGFQKQENIQLLIPELLDSHVFYLVLDESFLWLFIYETRLDIFSHGIKFEIDTM